MLHYPSGAADVPENVTGG
ncbi:hypothetical protein DBR36_00410 [Microbacterium sp. HMWF026]|nr:hypothetical protein DBR36_00410 [Microbacterium sp. HMWF026]